ncbi:MAG: DUF2959 domain-containing protein [Woeseiaceae bacterium]|nr:DUF2959 domain-containing protein [Woeseiaceae bacterium]
MIFAINGFIDYPNQDLRISTMPQPSFNLQILKIAAILALFTGLTGCASVKYSALEKVGIHKRDLLIDRVEDARDAQADTRENMVSAYEKLSSLVGYEGGELEDEYEKLSDAVAKASDTTEELDEQLAAIDRVSADLFAEWESELDLYTSQKLRADQERKLGLAKRQFGEMRSRMQKARNRVDPVMVVLNDNVLFLKHSLNAQALAALRGQSAKLENQVDALIRDMQIAIDEADAYINLMRGA